MVTTNKKYLLAIVAACAGLVLVLSLMLMVAGTLPEADKLYIHTYIHGVPVGGMTAAQAEATLMNHFQPVLDGQTVQYTIDEHMVAAFTFADFGANFDFAPLVQDAMQYSASRSLLSRMRRMFKRGHAVNTPVGINIVPQRMESVLSGLGRALGKPAQNAGFKMENGSIAVTAESPGFEVDLPAADAATRQVLGRLTSGVAPLTLHSVLPRYTTAHFQFDIAVLGTFQTKYAGANDDPRLFNLRRAADKIHNQVVHPGEVFSAGAVIGAHRADSGYKPAVVLVRGEPVEDIGGGVCQVVSTLYNAALLAELSIVQRHNHSAPVSYVENGFDATIAGDYYDLKFKNNTPHPVLITSQAQDGNLTLSIHGYEGRPPNRRIRFEARQLEILDDESYREVVDAGIPVGERQVRLLPRQGFRVALYKHVYIDGQAVETVEVNTSVYKPLQGVIAIGAG